MHIASTVVLKWISPLMTSQHSIILSIHVSTGTHAVSYVKGGAQHPPLQKNEHNQNEMYCAPSTQHA